MNGDRRPAAWTSLAAAALAMAALLPITGGAAVRAAADSTAPVFEVPRLSDITVDGSADDWGNHGFRVETLAPITGGLAPATNLSASFRLGWNENGLLLLADITDDHFIEGQNPKELWQKDSLELFWGIAPTVRDWVQTHIGPGRAADAPEIRTNIDDHRETTAIKAQPVNLKVARTKTATGYRLEALLPWSALNITPKVGQTATFQIVVNDVDPLPGNAGETERRQLMWFPEDGAYSDPAKMHTIRLSEKPSDPVRVAAIPDYSRYPRLTFSLIAPETMAGKTITATSGRPAASRSAAGRTMLGRTTLQKNGGGWATATLRLHNAGDYSALQIDGVPTGLRPAADLRQQALNTAELRFSPFVFSGATFPNVDFTEPERIADLLGGDYKIATAFYNATYDKVETPDKPGRYGAVVTVAGADNTTLKRYLTLYRTPQEVPWWNDPVNATATLPSALGIDPTVANQQSRFFGEYLTGAFDETLVNTESAAGFFAGLAERQPGDPAVNRLSPQATNWRWWVGLQQKIGDLKQYAYMVHTPSGYDTEKSKKWPLLLFLHGAGERGSDLRLAATHGPLKEIRNGRDLPFIVAAPQCPTGERWNPAQLSLLLDEIEAKYHVDKSRVYLTGLSMGGFGTWDLALAEPNRFAAIAPICGGGDPADAARLKNVPVWDFHGAKDTLVPIQLSEEMIAALKSVGADDVRFTVYPDAGHDAWTESYANPALYNWLLEQHR